MVYFVQLCYIFGLVATVKAVDVLYGSTPVQNSYLRDPQITDLGLVVNLPCHNRKIGIRIRLCSEHHTNADKHIIVTSLVSYVFESVSVYATVWRL